jgi:hypothetical protein
LTPEQSLQENLELWSGINRLTYMSGVRSVAHNIRDEDEAVRLNTQAHEQQMLGISPTETRREKDDMEIMSARDVNFHNHRPTNGIWKLLAGILTGAAIAGGTAWYTSQPVEPPEKTDFPDDETSTIRPVDLQ